MLSPGEIINVRVDIDRLEKACDQCVDTGIRKVIEAWIEEQEQKLASGKIPK
jgi:hypothetical protein